MSRLSNFNKERRAIEVDRKSNTVYEIRVDKAGEGIRLDRFLSEVFKDLSRSQIQFHIRNADVRVNEVPSKPSYHLRIGDHISASIPPRESKTLEPEAVEFGVVYEDESIIVVDKPPGLVVHPAPGHSTGTLVHGLLGHSGGLSSAGGSLRPGIVHRLDKDTSGLMVIARNDTVHARLVEGFKRGRVKKVYVCLVHGRMKEQEGTIELPVARHRTRRKEMSVCLDRGKHALTFWKKVREFKCGFSLLSVTLGTGRTHQIRVHLSHMGHPVVGDPVYGHGQKRLRRDPHYLKGGFRTIKRQMLHASALGLCHPARNGYMHFEAPLPEDFRLVLEELSFLEDSLS